MITQTVTVMERSTENIIIGRRGTYNTEEIVFDLAYLIETYGAGQAVLMVKRPTDATAYPAVTTQTDGQLLWVVSDVDTSFKGHGECELYWYVGQALAKSVIFGVAILRDIGDSSEIPPDPYKPWVDELVELGAETERNAEAAAGSASDAAESADAAEDAQEAAEDAQEAAEDAQEAAEAAVEHYPKIVDGYWYVWSNGEWVNTGTKAAGTDGKGISSIVSVKTSTSGNIDTYTMTVTYTDGTTETLTFTVTNGVSPSVTITPIAHGHQVTITDAEHPTGQTFEVLDGEVTEAELDVVRDTITQLDDIKAPVIVDTASGSIASFPDGADGMPVKDLTVSIDPIQDLHGYENPWPAGGGKQLINPAKFDGLPSESNGVTATDNGDGTVSLSGTATATAYLTVIGYKTLSEYEFLEPDTSYTFSANVNGNVYGIFGVYGSGTDYTDNTGAGKQMTFTSEQMSTLRYRLVIYVANGTNTNGMVIKPMICLSTATNPTVFAPYSNLCPISGRTGCEVARTGKNLFYPKYPGRTNNGITYIVNDDGTITTSETATNTSYAAPNLTSQPDKMTLVPPGTYTLTGGISASEIVYLGGVYIDGTNLPSTYDRGAGATFTFTKYAYVYPQIQIANGTTSNRTFNIQLELGSTATAYEQYRGTTIPISWQTEAGTVYRGNINPVTGVLTVDKAIAVFDGSSDEVWVRLSISGYDGYRYNITGALVGAELPSSGRKQVDCNMGYYSSGGSAVGVVFYTKNSSNVDVLYYYPPINLTEVSDFKSWLSTNNLQVLYPLAQPQTYQLDPITVSTLLGQNNIWTDCGDVEVDYPADTKLYIDKKLAALVAALS